MNQHQTNPRAAKWCMRRCRVFFADTPALLRHDCVERSGGGEGWGAAWGGAAEKSDYIYTHDYSCLCVRGKWLGLREGERNMEGHSLVEDHNGSATSPQYTLATVLVDRSSGLAAPINTLPLTLMWDSCRWYFCLDGCLKWKKPGRLISFRFMFAM